jgi:AcrR family transcriptional regulator
VAERRTQAERRAGTRSALVRAGRRLFAERGFDGVSTEEIVVAAGVSRGALYHHFDGKTGLFREVFEEIERDVTANVPTEPPSEIEPFDNLRHALVGFLQLSLDPELQQVTLVDGPAVLGYEEWHRLEIRYGLGIIQAGVQAAVDAGQMRPLPVPELAIVLLGASIEAALFVVRSEEPDATLAAMVEVLDALLDGLRT